MFLSSSEKMDIDRPPSSNIDPALTSTAIDGVAPASNNASDLLPTPPVPILSSSSSNSHVVVTAERPDSAVAKISDYPMLVTGRNDNSTFPHPSLMRTDSLQNLLRPTPVRYDSAPPANAPTAGSSSSGVKPSLPPSSHTQQGIDIKHPRPSSSASAPANINQANGSGIADRALNVTDALSYLDSVKMQFQDQPDVYNHFLDIMKDFKSQIIDTPGVIKRVSHLFHGHPSLIQGFNTFLPVGYRIETHDNSNYITVTTPTGTITQTGHNLSPTGNMSSFDPQETVGDNPNAIGGADWQNGGGQNTPGPGGMQQMDIGTDMYEDEAIEPAVQYVQKIKQRCDPETYRQFLDILSRYHQSPGEIDEEQVSMQISQLFKDAPDLRSDFRVFMPDKGQGNALLGPPSVAAPSRIGTPSEGKPSRRGKLAPPPVPEPASVLQKRKRKPTEKEALPYTSNVVGRNGHGNMVKKSKTQAQDLTPSSFAHSIAVPPTSSSRSKPGITHRSSSFQGQTQVHQTATSFERHTLHQTQSQADDKHFFDRVKRHLDSREVYNEFLKLINLFTQNYIDTGRLVKESRNFLGEGELMRQFREILGWDERKEHDHRVAEHQQQMFYGFNPAGGGKACAGQVGTVKTLPGRVDQAKLYGSYRRLPASEINVPCSGRDEMCKSVLNDEWVSHPTWASEDTGFFTNKKNIYEEALHRSEEERHEYDFHIEAITRTITMLEPINNKIAQLSQDERNSFKLKPNLGGQGKSIHQRVIKKIYGREPGLEVIKAMQETPALAIPVVLQRLKQKEEEWKRAQREWNKVWREVDSRNYYKSLDYQAVTCKAADKKSITSKSFVSQIEAVRDEHNARRAALIDPLFARTKPRYHLQFTMDDEGVLNDVLKLVFSFLDRTGLGSGSGHYNQSQSLKVTDRRRVEAFLRSFVPLFMGLESVAFQAAFVIPGVPQQNGQQSFPEVMATDPGGDASDIMDEGEDSVGSSSVRGWNGRGKPNGNSGAASPGGDMRKKLLKSEQAKTAASQRKTRASQDTTHPSPMASRFSSPAVLDSMDGLINGLIGTSEATAEGGSKRDKKRLLPFFCNTAFYVLLRLLETLYSRIKLFKTITARLVAENAQGSPATSSTVNTTKPSKPNPSFTGMNHLGERAAQAENFYDLILESCERLFDNEIEQHVFEDQMRFMLGMKYAYKIFTIDKLIGALIKQVLAIFADPKSQDLLENLKRLRAISCPNAQDLTNNRRVAMQVLGLEENLYRADWVSLSQTLHLQLLGGDDTVYEDTEVLTARWQSYLDAFVGSAETEGVPQARVQRPFLRKNLPKQALNSSTSDQPGAPAAPTSYVFQLPPSSVKAQSSLEIKICLRTYRIFYVTNTEDYLEKRWTGDEVKCFLTRLKNSNDRRRKWMEQLEAAQGSDLPAVLKPTEPATTATTPTVPVS